MALRTFLDSVGVEWQVWDVYPSTTALIEKRRRDRRVYVGVTIYDGPERRSGDDRRRGGPLVDPRFLNGWLSFASNVEKRRLAPIPVGWEALSELALDELRRRARVVPMVKLI